MFVGPSLVFLLSQQQTVLIITLGHCGTDIMTLRGKKKELLWNLNSCAPFGLAMREKKKSLRDVWFPTNTISHDTTWHTGVVDAPLSPLIGFECSLQLNICCQKWPLSHRLTQRHSLGAAFVSYFFFFFLMHWKKYLDLGDCKFHWMCLLLSC